MSRRARLVHGGLGSQSRRIRVDDVVAEKKVNDIGVAMPSRAMQQRGAFCVAGGGELREWNGRDALEVSSIAELEERLGGGSGG